MSDIQDELLFNGVSGLSCEDFIRGIRRFSMKEGRPKDDEWIALSAASFMGGSALRWYERLDEEVQESWKLLRRAMLDRWPEPSESGTAAAAASITIASTIPTPAAIPPATVAQRTLGSDQMRSGRIKVLKDGKDSGYIAEYSTDGARYKITPNVSDAAVVGFAPSGNAYYDMFIVNPALSVQRKISLLVWDETLKGSKMTS